MNRPRNKDDLRKYNSDYTKKYRLTPKGQWVRLRNHAQGRRFGIFNLTWKDFKSWFDIQPKICSYCYRSLDEVIANGENKAQVLSIDRIDSTKEYEIGNITLACCTCNRIKCNVFTRNEMQIIGKAVNQVMKNRIISGIIR